MVARVRTVALQGIDVLAVDAEVQIAQGLPAFTVVGLPDKAVGESRERVRAALTAIGLGVPPKRITVNLAPADLAKEGSHYDLPIALGMLIAMGAIESDAVASFAVLGELGLDGRINAVSGVLPAAIHAASGELGLICPAAQGGEAAWAGEIDVVAPRDLIALINHLKGTQVLSPPEPRMAAVNERELDLKDIKDQETAKRALEVAAAGGHNLLMVGPPGSGKSMLAARLPSILPPLSPPELLEVSMIHSVAGTLPLGESLVARRPFRAPHHTISDAGLIGGGSYPRPGEVSLAHGGVLFLDELPEFRKNVLEVLRQPMEDGVVTIARAAMSLSYPARFMLAAAMNPCPCGWHGDPHHMCTCAPTKVQGYLARVSGPL